jgi:hypothetical protein
MATEDGVSCVSKSFRAHRAPRLNRFHKLMADTTERDAAVVEEALRARRVAVASMSRLDVATAKASPSSMVSISGWANKPTANVSDAAKLSESLLRFTDGPAEEPAGVVR